MGWLLLLIPLALSAIVCIQNKANFAFLAMVVYCCLFCLLTMTGDPNYAIPGTDISAGVINGARAILHLVVLICCVLWVSNNPGGASRIRPNSILLFLAFLSTMAQAFSQLSNGRMFDDNGILRTTLNLVYFTNIFMLLYTINLENPKRMLDDLAKAYVAFAFGLSLVVLFTLLVYGNFPPGSRIGRPLNEGVFSAMILPAFVFVLFMRPNTPLMLFFLSLLIASGSRTAFAALAWALLLKVREYKGATTILVLVTAVGGFIYYFFDLSHVLDAAASSKAAEFYNRNDWSAGRTIGWTIAFKVIPQHWFFGLGGRTELVPGHRLHNGVLEGVVSFGVVFALISLAFYVYLFWLAFISRRVARNLPRPERNCFQAIILYAFIEFNFGTMYWTNLGDAFSLAVLIFAQAFQIRAETHARGSIAERTSRKIKSVLLPAS